MNICTLKKWLPCIKFLLETSINIPKQKQLHSHPTHNVISLRFFCHQSWKPYAVNNFFLCFLSLLYWTALEPPETHRPRFWWLLFFFPKSLYFIFSLASHHLNDLVAFYLAVAFNPLIATLTPTLQSGLSSGWGRVANSCCCYHRSRLNGKYRTIHPVAAIKLLSCRTESFSLSVI